MVSLFASSVADCMFTSLVKTKAIKLDIRCFSEKHTAIRRMSKDRVNHGQDNVSEQGDLSTISFLGAWTK